MTNYSPEPDYQIGGSQPSGPPTERLRDYPPSPGTFTTVVEEHTFSPATQPPQQMTQPIQPNYQPMQGAAQQQFVPMQALSDLSVGGKVGGVLLGFFLSWIGIIIVWLMYRGKKKEYLRWPLIGIGAFIVFMIFYSLVLLPMLSAFN